MPELNATISPGLWRALLDYAERTQEPIAHIVSKALAEYLQVSHHTLYVVVGIPVDYRDNHRLMEIVHPNVLN